MLLLISNNVETRYRFVKITIRRFLIQHNLTGYLSFTPLVRVSHFVVNVDATESDLASRDIEELASMLKGAADESGEDKPTAELIAQYQEDVENRQDIWIYLMLAVFALAVTEMFLANRI